MNPEKNRFENLFFSDPNMRKQQQDAEADAEEELSRVFHSVQSQADQAAQLLRADGSPVPKHWSVFTVGEHVVIKDYTFKVAYIGESNILFEPVGPAIVGGQKP